MLSLNRPKDESDVDLENVVCYPLDGEATISLKDICTDKGTNYSFSLDLTKLGYYEVTITASSTQSELATDSGDCIPYGNTVWYIYMERYRWQTGFLYQRDFV